MSDWLTIRRYLKQHRYELGVEAADEYPAELRVEGTPLLAPPRWRPPEPVPLHAIAISYSEPSGSVADLPAPVPDGYPTYAAAMAALDAPAVFENRPTFRLTGADLVGEPRLAFTAGGYFDGVNIGEAAGHEFAAAKLSNRPDKRQGAHGLRRAVGDPCDLSRRPANMAISTLTLRHDRGTGRLSFPLHWRDPTRVGHAGGLHTTVPVGVFQPAGDSDAERPDLWLSMLREFAEELAGHPEHYDRPVDPDFVSKMEHARAWVLGLGVDPLTFATDLLAAVVVDAEVYDELFADAAGNDEGRVLELRDFDTIGDIRMQAASAALLALAARNVSRFRGPR